MVEVSKEDRELAHLLAELEGEFDARGWDQPHQLMTIQSPDNEFCVQTLPMAVDDPAPKFLASLARAFEEQNALIQRLIEAQPHIYGFVFAYEAYRAAGLRTEEEIRALNATLRPDQTYADVPGSLEMRGLVAVTADGAAIQVFRDRGALVPVAIPWQAHGGPILMSLLRMTIVVARHRGMPEPVLAKLKDMMEELDQQPQHLSDF